MENGSLWEVRQRLLAMVVLEAINGMPHGITPLVETAGVTRILFQRGRMLPIRLTSVNPMESVPIMEDSPLLDQTEFLCLPLLRRLGVPPGSSHPRESRIRKTPLHSTPYGNGLGLNPLHHLRQRWKITLCIRAIPSGRMWHCRPRKRTSNYLHQ